MTITTTLLSIYVIMIIISIMLTLHHDFDDYCPSCHGEWWWWLSLSVVSAFLKGV